MYFGKIISILTDKNMSKSTTQLLEKMDQEDQEKVSYFMSLLLSQTKYSALQKEISLRRKEIRQGKSLTHKEIWNELHV